MRNYNNRIGSYYGLNRTYEVIAQKYAQNGLIKDLREYLDNYNAY